MSSDLFYICTPCLRERDVQVELVRRDVEASEDHCAATEWVCPQCGTVCAIYLDMGELDLGVVRESAEKVSDADFEVFTDEPWRT